ncbi:MAG: non-homologous end-joining DNA ligase [Thermoanaerobacterales bacterium]|nr:non-homologous end-joining DNA ligase [Thermoanaerobacterales bacterium]
MPRVLVDEVELELTNLEKIYWPADGYTKGDLLSYYREVGPAAVNYLAGRPAVMNRFPDGISGENFYQKDCPPHAPEWVRTAAVEHEEKTVRYVVHGDLATLLWVANLGAIEMHAWLSRVPDLMRPDIAVIDLDPAEGATFAQVIEVAKLARVALGEFGLDGFPKTSGATGLHLFVPVEPRHSFTEVTRAMKVVAELIVQACPFATVERLVERRRGKVYVDYLQNTFGKSMAFPYSVRPRPGAPVSAPLSWDELEEPDWRPGDLNIRTIPERLAKKGDLYEGFFARRGTLEDILALA